VRGRAEQEVADLVRNRAGQHDAGVDAASARQPLDPIDVNRGQGSGPTHRVD